MKPAWFYSTSMYIFCGTIMSGCVIFGLACVFIAMKTGIPEFGRIGGMCMLGMIPSGLGMWLIEGGMED